MFRSKKLLYLLKKGEFTYKLFQLVTAYSFSFLDFYDMYIVDFVGI